METHPAGARRPLGSGSVTSETRPFLPRLRAVGAPEQRRVFDAGVNQIGIRQRRLEMPGSLELPRVRCAVVPLVRARDAVVRELIAGRLPRLSTVIRPLNDLAEPCARLRCIDPVRVGRRSLHVVNLPTAEVRSADIPAVSLAVSGEDEAALAGPDENSNAAHNLLDSSVSRKSSDLFLAQPLGPGPSALGLQCRGQSTQRK